MPKLLPLSSRPTMKPCLKKRPQSVMSSSTSPSLPTSSIASAPAVVSPIQQLSPAKVASASKASSSRALIFNTSTYSPDEYNHDNQVYKRTKVQNDQEQIKALWKVGTAVQDLPKVPMFHLSPPLTHFVINGDDLVKITPNDIASTIVECVASMSAIGQYNPSKASAIIQTLNGVTFSISLFNTERNFSNQQHKQCRRVNDILIDIERKHGDTIQFHWTVKYIFDSIQQQLQNLKNGTSTNVTKATNQNSSTSSNSKLSAIQDQDNQSVTTRMITTDCTFQNTMETICTLLRKDRLDAKILGMESLDFLINIQSSNEHSAYLASRAVLVNDDTCPWHVVRDEIMKLININNDDEDEESIMNNRDLTTTQLELKMKQIAFKIFANSLDTCRRNNELRQILTGDPDEWKDILTGFVKQMNSSKSDLCVIHQISRCVLTLISIEAALKVEARELNVVNLMLQDHRRVGDNSSCIHHGLVDVSRFVVDSLNQCK